jgi:SAM-dependent methyltransferase
LVSAFEIRLFILERDEIRLMSTIFQWDPNDVETLLTTCETDGLLPLIIKYMRRNTLILESGCGLGRYVKYLQDRGWQMVGLEWSQNTLKALHGVWPELEVVVGDAENSPFPDNTFDGVLSLGVVEHWPKGLEKPLRDIYRVLKPGGVAIITVPCLNRVRQIKQRLFYNEFRALMGCIIKRKWKPLNRFQKDYKYMVYPASGNFYEYRLSKEEFLSEIRKTGFQVLEHLPLGEIDGIYHELNPLKVLVKFHTWKFKVSVIGCLVNNILKKWPFFHSHMQTVIVTKTDSKGPPK